MRFIKGKCSCYAIKNGPTRVITSKRGGHPPLVLEGYHLGNPTLHPPRKGECCFRWYVTTLDGAGLSVVYAPR
jgi:hypothetical protein